ncbi:MAG TPA: nucleotide pyrophosphatase/phosphodiesterase family protein [Verrucomicrobiae bacterium]|nr:nucleotide pyrophosphatase/phosphodiesterase family protein [Verrucomicrobiae bacterium]
MKRTVVLNVVGLTASSLERHQASDAHTPAAGRMHDFATRGAMARIVPALPAVTCTAQSTYLTGTPPAQHGIVANGWYNRELAEVQFWKQANQLVSGKKIWDELRELDPTFTCAKLFWWYNMYSSADYSITPRPMYPADGRKFFDVYSWPYSIRTEIKKDLGEFPFATFWGPAAGLPSPQGARDAATRWIAESAKWIENKYSPTLSLVYLPHLDYNFQRLGPNHPGTLQDLREIDNIVGGLMDFFAKRSVQVILLSEYGITPVDTPIHINRILRKKNWIVVKDELGREMLDCGASKAFAVADHQIAHVYLKDPSFAGEVRATLEKEPGIAQVLDRAEQAKLGIDHPRAGDLIAVARENAWFTYYYWFDDNAAPDFARCVDIHRKPGYDPVELFLDPKISAVKAKIFWRLLKKKLGFRMLMDVIPLDATLVKGSHGCRPENENDYPVFISERKDLLSTEQIEATDVYHLIKRHVLY